MTKTYRMIFKTCEGNPKRIRIANSHWLSMRLFSQKDYLHFRFIIVFHGADIK